MIIFELTTVTKRFGQLHALKDISLVVKKGERVVLIGPSGAGKSTLLRLLNGSEQADEGEVKLFGQAADQLSTAQLRRLQQRIGTIYQQFHLVNNLRVVHNINAGKLGRWSLWRAILSLIRPQEVPDALAALEQVGIPEKLYDRTDQLSGGQQQRVAIARVLVQDPDAILADEPIASLDPERAREVMDLLGDLAGKMGKTLVVSVHTVHFARTHFDRVIGLRAGEILFDLAPSALTDADIEALYRLEDAESA